MKRLYKFGPFHLDVTERVLRRNGQEIPLRPKTYEVLLVLIENSEHIVEKEVLMQRGWPNSFVEEANITQNISVLRKILSEGDDNHQYIETIPKRGYRFTAAVKEIGGEVENLTSISNNGQSRTGIINDQSSSRIIDSLVVLPFVNESSDPQMEYLSDGITESIINALSQLPKLRVMARSTVFRYKEKDPDPQEVGRHLNVNAVLKGRVLLLSERLIIRTELVDVIDGSQIWGEQYNRVFSDIFAVQEDISKAISQNLRVKLNSEQKRLLSKHHTEDFEAYRLYLKGRHYWNKREEKAIKKAMTLFKEAIELDPTYALAYTGLSDCYRWLAKVVSSPRDAMPKAKSAALKALEIDDSLAEAHASLATILSRYDWDWSGAENEFKRSLALNPNYASAHHWYGVHLRAMGDSEGGLAELVRAQELDPLSPMINADLGYFLYLIGRFDQAIEQLQSTIEMEPSFMMAHFNLGHIYKYEGMYEEAISEFLIGMELKGEASEAAEYKVAFELCGWKGYWQKDIELAQLLSKETYIPPINLAAPYIEMGEKEQAFEWLEKAYRDRSSVMIFLKSHPIFDSLRSDARFLDLIRRVGLP